MKNNNKKKYLSSNIIILVALAVNILCLIPRIGNTQVLSCSNAVIAPTTINGVSVTGSGTGDVKAYPGPTGGCGTWQPTGAPWLGSNSQAFSYTFTFSSPVSRVVVSENGMDLGETYSISTNGTGTNNISVAATTCPGVVVITGNTISVNTTTTPQGALLAVTNSGGTFTKLTISGPGGYLGTVFALCPGCLAPMTPPTLSATSIQNTCPASTVNLNTLVTSAIPTGTTIAWLTNWSTPYIQYPTPTTATAGTYYAIIYDPLNNCYSQIKLPSVTVNISGPSSPILSQSTLTNICPTTTVDLNSIVSSTTPTGGTLVWFTNSNHTGTAYSTPNAAGAGTYYAFYKDASNCYSSASNAVIVTITSIIQPTLTTTTLTNTCPANTADLNSIVSSTTPTGATLVWFTNNSHTGTAYTTPNAAGAGTYYAFYKNAGNCYSTASNAVTVTITNIIQPTITTTILKNTCPTTTVNLNSIVTSTTPTGTTLVWFTNNTHTGSAYSTPTTATTGIYFAFYYKNSTGCYSPASAQVTVTTNLCDPCSIAKANATTLSGSISTSQSASPVYNISGNLIINGDVSFFHFFNPLYAANGVELIMNPNSSITVAANATLDLTSTHIYTCADMWKGINVLPGGKLKINAADGTGTTVIEDAETAINFDFPTGTAPNYGSDFLLNIEGTIFNRNNTSIKISNYNLDPQGATRFPFSVDACLFTSRRIDFVPGSNIWVGIYDIYSLNNASVYFDYPNAPETLVSPFIPNSQFPDNVTDAYLKISGVQKKPDYGIVLSNIGIPLQLGSGITLGISPFARNSSSSNLLRSSRIYDVASAPNLFDNLKVGIDANASNFTIKNSVFQKSIEDGIGINMYNGKNYKAVIDGAGIYDKVKNSFFDQAIAIQTEGYEHITVDNAVLRSNRNRNGNNSFSNLGSDGIYSVSDGYQDLNIINCEFTNIYNPISIDDVGVNNNQSDGFVNVNNNRFYAAHPDFAGNGNEAMGLAVYLAAEMPGKSGTLNRSVNCNNNIIDGAYSGIYSSYWLGKNTIINNNTINIIQHPANSPRIRQYGINLEGGIPFNGRSGNMIQNNIITGDCSTCNQNGIVLFSQLGTNIGCNNVSNLQNGFRFFRPNTGTIFRDNYIDPSNQYGLTLENGGVIGQQGNPRSRGNLDACTANNSWGGDNATWLSQNHFKTYVNNSVASLSKMYIKNNAWMNPDGAGRFTIGSTPYQTANIPAGSKSLYITPNDDFCKRCTFINQVQMEGRMAEKEADEDIADGTIELTGDEQAQQLYVLQQQLYEKLKRDDELLNSSPVLQTFVQTNSWDSYDFIYYTAQYIAKEDWATVNTLLSYFPSNNKLDDNYYDYYNWVYDLKNNNIANVNKDDVLVLAQKCPATHGTVVFAARNLYNRLTKRQNYFEDNCSDGISTSRIAKPQIAEIELPQTVEVFPNPAINGNVNIKLPKTSEGHWQVNITNTMGKIVTKQLVANSTYAISLSIENSKGLHIVQVINTVTGKQFINKLIVE